MNTPEHMQRTVTYDVRAVFIAEPMYNLDRLDTTRSIIEVTNAMDFILDRNASLLVAKFTEGYRNDDVTPVDVRNEEVTREVTFTLSEPATLWDQIKLTLKTRWPRLFGRLTVEKSERVIRRDVTFTVPVSRNVTVQFVDPLALPPPACVEWRRVLYGRSGDAEAIVQVLRRRAVEAVKGGP